MLTDGTIIDGVELDRIFREAWDNAFGDMTDEEKELFKDVRITIDTLTLDTISNP